MAEHRGDQTGQSFDDQRHHGLTAAPAPVRRGADIQPVLGDVEVEVREISDAEVLEQLEETEELEALEGCCDLIHHFGAALQHPAIEQGQLRHGDGVVCRIEIVQVAQQVAAGVAHFSVDVGQLTQDAGTDGDIGGVVD